jgi:lysophospholipase L1-like esterase
MPRSLLRPLFPLWLTLSVLAQEASSGKDVAPKPAPLRVTIVGASLSAGFVDGPLAGGNKDNRTTPLKKAVASWLGDGGAVQSRADLLMFTDPFKLGARQVARAVKDGGDLLVAIDFLFWYAYGYTERNDADERKARTERMEQGLAQLAQWSGPLVVADLPDMQGADRRMLSPLQIPKPETLNALNERIAAWAKARPGTQVVPLRTWVDRMKQQGIELPLQGGAVQVPKGGLLQGDRLHPNRLGMAWLLFQLQEPVRALAPKAMVEAMPQWTMDQCIQGVDASLDLADLKAAAKEGPPPDRAKDGLGGK